MPAKTPTDGKPRLNLLFVSRDLFPPFRVDVKVLFGKELVGRGHTVDWLLQSEAACNKSYATTWPGGRAWVGRTDLGTTIPNRLMKHIYALAHDFRLIGLARKNNYDAIQVKDKFLAALLAIPIARLKKIPFIYWLSYPFPEASITSSKDGTARYKWIYLIRGYILHFLLYRIILPSSRFVFVQSEQMKADLAAQGVDVEKMQAVPMGVSLELYPLESFATRENLPEVKSPSVVYIGTLEKIRRMDFLVRAFAKVLADIPSAILYVVGGGDVSDLDLLKNAAAQLNIQKNIVFVGQVQHAIALEYVYQANVCVSPFYPTPVLNSTSPTKLVEYMAMARPVVANNHPEQRLVIEESGAGICVPWDETAFADAITALLKSPARADAMGEAGRSYVENNRDYPKIADAVEQRYLTICFPERT
jgi:glycosyltransferase involved in cell wall biosynthesis